MTIICSVEHSLLVLKAQRLQERMSTRLIQRPVLYTNE